MNAAHGLRRDGEEMPPIGGFQLLALVQSEKRFVDERGCVQRVRRAPIAKLGTGKGTQLVANEREDPSQRLWIAIPKSVQPGRDGRAGSGSLGHTQPR
jgi:hypothetical protein